LRAPPARPWGFFWSAPNAPRLRTRVRARAPARRLTRAASPPGRKWRSKGNGERRAAKEEKRLKMTKPSSRPFSGVRGRTELKTLRQDRAGRAISRRVDVWDHPIFVRTTARSAR